MCLVSTSTNTYENCTALSGNSLLCQQNSFNTESIYPHNQQQPHKMSTNYPSKISYVLVLLFILTIPVDNYANTLINIIVILFGLFSILNIVVDGEWRLNKIQLWALVVMVYSLIVSVIIITDSTAPSTHIGRVRTLLLYCIVIFTFVTEINTYNRAIGTLISVSIAAIIASLLSLINLFVDLQHAFHRAPSTYSLFVTDRTLGASIPYGSYGILLSVSVPFLILCIYKPKIIYNGLRIDRARVYSAICLIILALGLYVTQSRSTMISIMCMLIFIFVFIMWERNEYMTKRLRRTVAGNEVLSFSILFILLFGLVYTANLLFSDLFGSRLESISARLNQYITSVDIILNNPIIANGFGHFQLVYGSDIQPHNLWLYIGSSLGGVAAFLWFSIFVLVFKFLLSLSFSDKTGSSLFWMTVTCMLVGATIELSLYPGFSDVPAMFIGLILACTGIYDIESENNK